VRTTPAERIQGRVRAPKPQQRVFPIFPAGGAGRGPRLHLTSATACMMPGNIRFRVARQNEIGSLRDMRSGTRFWRALSAAPFTRARLFPAMVSRAESFGLESRSSILPNIREQGPRRSSTAVNDWNAWLRRLALGGSGQRNVYSLNWRQARSTDDRRQPFEGASNGRKPA